MNLNVNGIARVARVGMLAAAALLAACGGGEQEQTFVATRIIAFGDEYSVLNTDGSKYTVNATLASGALDCTNNPLWIQLLASSYGLVFPQCKGTAVGDPVSRIYASNGATVADLATQVDQAIAAGGFRTGDLTTVLVGANDVVAQFAQYPAVTEDQLLKNVEAAGEALAKQVNRIAALNAKVLISTIPNVGYMPYAGSRAAGSTNVNPLILSRLTKRFNDAMLANLTNDGRKIGLIQLDEFLTVNDKATALNQGTYTNTTAGACAVALPACTTTTLVTGATSASWMWADSRRIGPGAQYSLGSLAVSRAQSNPF